MNTFIPTEVKDLVSTIANDLGVCDGFYGDHFTLVDALKAISVTIQGRRVTPPMRDVACQIASELRIVHDPADSSYDTVLDLLKCIKVAVKGTLESYTQVLQDNVKIVDGNLLNPTSFILRKVFEERGRQENLRAAGKFQWTCAAVPSDEPRATAERKLAVLSEEVGEVAHEVTDFGISKDRYEDEPLPFPKHREVHFRRLIQTELIQVAACAVAWSEALEQELKSLASETPPLPPLDEGCTHPTGPVTG